MPTYDDLRRAWIDALSRTGELELLSPDQRRILERGSLAILGFSRARELRRGRALLHSSLIVSSLALLAGLAMWLLPPATAPAAPGLILAVAGLALVAQVPLALRIARKRQFYSALTATALAHSVD